MKDRAKGRRGGQHFPSTLVHDLILFHSIETFPGMKICFKKRETREKEDEQREEDAITNKEYELVSVGVTLCLPEDYR